MQKKKPRRPTLRRGAGRRLADVRAYVKELQAELSRVGYALAEDGLYGERTEAAVRSFQLRAGLSADGVAGPKTWAVLLSEPEAVEHWHLTSYTGDELRPHLEAARPYRRFVVEAAFRTELPIPVILGLGSRESGWGLFLKPEGPAGHGDSGHGHGLMQIDGRFHRGFIKSGDWKDPQKNILYGAAYLRSRIDRVPVEGQRALRAGLAAYNASLSRVVEAMQQGRSVDSVTTGGDYSRDVLERAGWFQAVGW